MLSTWKQSLSLYECPFVQINYFEPGEPQRSRFPSPGGCRSGLRGGTASLPFQMLEKGLDHPYMGRDDRIWLILVDLTLKMTAKNRFTGSH
jgi:hypothetical protein